MLDPYRTPIQDIACLYAHLGPPDGEGNRVYDLAAARLAPGQSDSFFATPVRYGRFSERERHASGLSRELVEAAPPRSDAAAFLGAFLRGTPLLLTLVPREELDDLLTACGTPRIVDLAFAAEFFLPDADQTGLRPLWEQLHGTPREKRAFSAREAVELSLDLLRHISGRVLNPEVFPPAAALRHYLAQSDTLFGTLFGHLADRCRDYFGDLLAPASVQSTPDWQGFLETAPPASPAPSGGGERVRRAVPLPHLADLCGALAARQRGYQRRPSQIGYAERVAAALNDGAVLTIEAGTGTGKTQGYLLPLLEYLRRNPAERAAVSTYTKGLQEQILRRELPLSLSLDPAYRRIPVVLLKGKSNYLCAEKLDHLYDEGLRGGQLLAWLSFVQRLYHFRTAEGEAIGPRIRHHLYDGLFFRRLQQESSARSGCTRRHRRCPAQVVAAEAANARLIITNHHKLALLDRDETLGGRFGHYLIDEANHFEQALRGAFAVEVASRPIADTLTYLQSVLRRLPERREAVTALAACDGLQEALARFTAALGQLRPGGARGEAVLLPAEHTAFSGGRLENDLAALQRALTALAQEGLAFLRESAACQALGLPRRTADRMKTAQRDLQEQADTLQAVGERVSQPGSVAAATLYVHHWSLTLAAVEVAGLLHDHVYTGRRSVVFTSATLRDGEGFEGFRRIAGMPDPPAGERDGEAEADGRVFRFAALPSPFSATAVSILVPPGAVSGAFAHKRAWLERVSELLPALINQNRGRTLVLFASYQDLEAVARRVSAAILAEGYPLLVQRNGAPTLPLCEEFRTIRESVLFGVDSFWYGVDFPGETLTQVIITRLPYPHPQDPLQIARRHLLPREAYWHRYHYEMAIKLRQGIGRLIRSEGDHGRVVILDSRYRPRGAGGGTP